MPYPHPERVLLQMLAQPIASGKKFPLALFTSSLAREVVVAQSPLRNRDGVVLQADPAVVVEHRNASGIVIGGIIRFLAKQHVVFAKLMDARTRIGLRRLMPEGELALPRNKIGTEDAPIVLQTTHNWTLA